MSLLRALVSAILIRIMWITAALSIFNAIGGQEAGAQRAQAAAIEAARNEQQKVYAMAAGIVGLGVLGLLLAKR